MDQLLTSMSPASGRSTAGFGGSEPLEMVLRKVAVGVTALAKYRRIREREGADAAAAFEEEFRFEAVLEAWGLGSGADGSRSAVTGLASSTTAAVQRGGNDIVDDEAPLAEATRRGSSLACSTTSFAGTSARRKLTVRFAPKPAADGELSSGNLPSNDDQGAPGRASRDCATQDSDSCGGRCVGGSGGDGEVWNAVQDASTTGGDSHDVLVLIRDAFEPPVAGRGHGGAGTARWKGGTMRSVFDSTPEAGVSEDEFIKFIAPAITGSYEDTHENRCLAAQLDVNANGRIMWEEFSSFFVQRTATSEVKVSGAQFYYATGAKHHSQISSLLFARPRTNDASWNAALDRFCFTGGFDGTVHMWDSQFLDHVGRVHYIPAANKQRRWINDMCFTGAGRLAIAQSRGFMYIYNVFPKAKPLLHRVLRAGRRGMQDDHDTLIRLQVERSKFCSSAAPTTRLSAATIPDWEVCVLNTTTANADLTCCTGIRSGTTSHHTEPIAVGFDNGRCSIYDVHKPVDIVTSIDPLESFDFFADGGTVRQVFDDSIDLRLLCLGHSAKLGRDSLHFVDYEKMVPVMQLVPKQRQQGSNSLLRFDYDAQSGILVACGPSRTATIFSSSFPDPVAYLSDHNTPIVSVMHNAAAYQLYTVTTDCTFHLYDVRMHRKIMSIADGDVASDGTTGRGGGGRGGGGRAGGGGSSMTFSAAAFDAHRGSCVGGAAVPVVLRETVEMSGGPGTNAGGSATAGGTPRRTGIGSASLPCSPDAAGAQRAADGSGIRGALGFMRFNAEFGQLVVVEGDTLAVRETRDDFDAVAQRFRLPSATVTAMGCDNHGRRLAVAFGARVVMFSAMTGSDLASFVLPLHRGASDDVTSVACGEAHAVLGPCIFTGTYAGLLAVHGDTTTPQLVSQRQLEAAILSITPVAHGTKLLLATSAGDLLQMNLDTLSITRILSFNIAHAGTHPSRPPVSAPQRSSSSGGGGGGADSKRSMSVELDIFTAKSYAQLNESCESIAAFDSAYFVALYGTGTVCFCKVVNLETTMICNFPATRAPEISGSCVAATARGRVPPPPPRAAPRHIARSRGIARVDSRAAELSAPDERVGVVMEEDKTSRMRCAKEEGEGRMEHLVAVGDFGGGVTVFSLEGYFLYDPRHAHPAMNFFADADASRSVPGAAAAVQPNSDVARTTPLSSRQNESMPASADDTGAAGAGSAKCVSLGGRHRKELLNSVFEYVSLKTSFTVMPGHLISDLAFLDPALLAASLQEDGCVVLCTTRGALVRHFAVDQWSRKTIVPCTNGCASPSELATHRFFAGPLGRSQQAPSLDLELSSSGSDDGNAECLGVQRCGEEVMLPGGESAYPPATIGGTAGADVSPTPLLPAVFIPSSSPHGPARPRSISSSNESDTSPPPPSHFLHGESPHNLAKPTNVRSALSQVLCRSPERLKRRKHMRVALPQDRITPAVPSAPPCSSSSSSPRQPQAHACAGPARHPDDAPRRVLREDAHLVEQHAKTPWVLDSPLAVAEAVMRAQRRRLAPHRPGTAEAVTQRLAPRHHQQAAANGAAAAAAPAGAKRRQHRTRSAAPGSRGRAAASAAGPSGCSGPPQIEYPAGVPPETDLMLRQLFIAHPPSYTAPLPRPATPVFMQRDAHCSSVNAPQGGTVDSGADAATRRVISALLPFSAFAQKANIEDKPRAAHERVPGELTAQLERAMRSAKRAAGVVGRGVPAAGSTHAGGGDNHVFSQLLTVAMPSDVVATVNECAQRDKERRNAQLRAAIGREAQQPPHHHHRHTAATARGSSSTQQQRGPHSARPLRSTPAPPQTARRR